MFNLLNSLLYLINNKPFFPVRCRFIPMSSSVFIESCTKAFKGGIGSENEVAISGSPDSNLVVVYGKNGVNFDKRGIENLIGGYQPIILFLV